MSRMTCFNTKRDRRKTLILVSFLLVILLFSVLLEELIQALVERDLLLVLDNCEHLKEAAADFIDALLEYTNEPRILATSRDPIELVDEHRFDAPHSFLKIAHRGS